MRMGKRAGLQECLNMSECHATTGRRGRILERLLQGLVNNNRKRTWQQGKDLSIAICCNWLNWVSSWKRRNTSKVQVHTGKRSDCKDRNYMNVCPSPHRRTVVLSQGKSNKMCSFLPHGWWKERPCCRSTAVTEGLTTACCFCMHILCWEITCPFLTPSSCPENAHK